MISAHSSLDMARHYMELAEADAKNAQAGFAG
jgi:hypothetical protein